jgi:hypothetical protein
MLGKPIKLDIMNRISAYLVAEIDVETKWDGTDIVTIRLIPHSDTRLKHNDYR